VSTGEYVATNNPRPQFVETEALIAIMDGDSERAQQIVSGFLPNELRRFDGQLVFLRDVIARVRRPA
jgi:hypothetical protein